MDDRTTPKPHLAETPPENAREQLSQRIRSLQLPRDATASGSSSGRVAWTLCLLLAVSTGVLGYLLYREYTEAPTAPPEKPSAKRDAHAKSTSTPPTGCGAHVAAR